jgi:hypothetical protein
MAYYVCVRVNFLWPGFTIFDHPPSSLTVVTLSLSLFGLDLEGLVKIKKLVDHHDSLPFEILVRKLRKFLQKSKRKKATLAKQ